MSTCETCFYWREGMYHDRVCHNSKLTDLEPRNQAERADALVYSYYEGGEFCPGPDFGCVHHRPLPTNDPTRPAKHDAGADEASAGPETRP